MQRNRLIFWTTFLGGAGLLAGYAEFAPEPNRPEVVGVVQRAAAVAPAPLPPQPLATLRAAAMDSTAATATAPRDGASAPDLFAAKSWERKPPPAPAPLQAAPVAPPPPAPPAAPPLPFQFMGRLEEGTQAKVFLQRGERLYAVSVGDVIDGTWRVSGIDARQLTLVYLPLDLPQTLPLGRS